MLEKKNKTKNDGLKKIIAAKFLDYNIVDNRFVITQVQELQVIIYVLLAEGNIWINTYDKSIHCVIIKKNSLKVGHQWGILSCRANWEVVSFIEELQKLLETLMQGDIARRSHYLVEDQRGQQGYWNEGSWKLTNNGSTRYWGCSTK